jgi:deazaflavin-dependent oxidoreductase (nitroreductase family)
MNDEGTARGVRRMVDAGLEKVVSEKLVHVTTTGRKTRNPHTVELWFAVRNGKVYLSHEGSETDWMKNIEYTDQILFEIGGKNFTGRARILENGTEEAWEAKVALYEKYYGKASKEIIEDWFSLSRLITIEPS